MRVRAGKMFVAVLTLFLFSTLFFLGAAVPAGASTGCATSASDERLVVELIDRALAKAGLPSPESRIMTKGSYKIVVYIYNGAQKFKTPVKMQPVPKPQPQPAPQPQPNPAPPAAPPVQGLSADEQKMLDLVNAARAEAGLRPLQADMALVKLARLKAQDMIKNNYFSHTSPTYGSPFDMMKGAGVTYRYAGENLAGAPAVDIAHTNLMKSPGHRANILKPNFTKSGIGVVNGGPYGKMFVQMFTG
ncbi:MAG: CAP domain-containing protein [Bacillota bacterium]